MACQGVLRLFVLVPVERARRVSPDNKIPDLALRNGVIVIIDDLRIEARNDLATGSWPQLSRNIRNHHVQRFGRPDRIQNLNSKTLFEVVKHRGRQRLARRDGVANGREIELSAIGRSVRQEFDEIRRHREEQRRPMPFNHLKHALRARRTRHQKAGPTHRQGKIKAVPQSVSEE